MSRDQVDSAAAEGQRAVLSSTPQLVLVEVVGAERMARLAGRQHDLGVVPAAHVEHLTPRRVFPGAEALQAAVADAHHGRAVAHDRHRSAVEEPGEQPPAFAKWMRKRGGVHLIPRARAARPLPDVGRGVSGSQEEDVVPRLETLDRADVVPPARVGRGDDRVEPGRAFGPGPLVVAPEDVGRQLVGKGPAPETVFECLEGRGALAAVDHAIPALEPLQQRHCCPIPAVGGGPRQCAVESLQHLLRRVALQVELHGRRRRHVDAFRVREQARDAGRAERRRPVARDERPLAAGDPVVRRGQESAGRIEHARQPAGSADAARPCRCRASERPPAIAIDTRGHLSGHQVADVAVHVGIHDILRERGHVVQRGLEVSPGAGAVERFDGIGIVAGVEARPAQHERALLALTRHVGGQPRRGRLPVGGLVGVNHTTRRAPHLERCRRRAAAYRNGRRFDLHRLPALCRLHPLAGQVEALEHQILHVGAGVGEAPRDARVVTNRHKRRAGQRHALHVEAGGHEVHLVPHRRQLDEQVRVVGQQRPAGGRALARHHPGVAVGARGTRVEPGEGGRIRGPREARERRRR